MSNESRVSIIIAARNYARFLDEAIRSALAQTVPCEVIYADDASLDDSLAIARSHGIVVLSSDRHLGVCTARNRGDYFVFLDGDDRMPPDFIARHLAAISPGTPFVFGPAKAFGDGPHAKAYWTGLFYTFIDKRSVVGLIAT